MLEKLSLPENVEVSQERQPRSVDVPDSSELSGYTFESTGSDLVDAELNRAASSPSDIFQFSGKENTQHQGSSVITNVAGKPFFITQENSAEYLSMSHEELSQRVSHMREELSALASTKVDELPNIGFTGLKQEALVETLNNRAGVSKASGWPGMWRWRASGESESLQGTLDDMCESAYSALDYASTRNVTLSDVTVIPGGIIVTSIEAEYVFESKPATSTFAEISDRYETGRMQEFMLFENQHFDQGMKGVVPVQEYQDIFSTISQLATDFTQIQERAVADSSLSPEQKDSLRSAYQDTYSKWRLLGQLLSTDIVYRALSLLNERKS